MPIYAYYSDGTGPLYIDSVGWISNVTTSSTTSSWYPFGGATYITPTLSATNPPLWFRHVYHDVQSVGFTEEELQWAGFQNRAAAFNANQATQREREAAYVPPSPAIIRERAEAETQRQREIAAQTEERLAQARAEQEHIKTAKARARELLLEHLTPEQRRMFEKDNWFIVEGGKSKTKYRIRGSAVAGNIDVFKGERVTHRLCCHCDYSIPTHDQHLAQKLMLEHAEDDFLRIANRH